MTFSEWLKHRWLAFRIGYTTYLVLPLSIINFILISFAFLLKDFSLNIITYAVLGVVCIIPSACILGELHIKKQMSTDQRIPTERNPIIQQMIQKLDSIEYKLDNYLKKEEGLNV